MKTIQSITIVVLICLSTLANAQTPQSIAREINTILENAAKYNEQCIYKANTKEIKIIGNSCTITIPTRGASVTYSYNPKTTYEYKGKTYPNKNHHRIRFSNYSKKISSDCKSTGVKTKSTSLVALKNKTQAMELKDLFTQLIRKANGSSTSYSSNNNSVRSTSYTNKDLDYVNAECQRYNKYDAQWMIDPDRNKVILSNKFGKYTANISDVRFSINEKTGSIDMKCKYTSEKCIIGPTSNWSSFNCSLKDNDGVMIRHIDDVIGALRKAVESVR